MIYLNTKPIVKPKKKPKAEREQYAAWCEKYDIDPTGKTKKKKAVIRNIALPGTVYKPFIRETVRYPSLDTGHRALLLPG
jgi:predicted transglutaminase-like protease